MGIILFWVYDRSEGSRRTKMLRPMHKLAAELLKVVYEDDPQ
ncbi:TetR family transcriptional regulator C-terminal domain-containing protein [Granulicella paludicola]|nr:TetR family transcriptional regulator C-terminal domain-containing protein [Granulicella paludicola]